MWVECLMRIPHSSHCTALLNLLWAALRKNTVTFACLISCSGEREREIALLQHQYTVIFANHGRRVGLEMCDNDGGWRWNKNTHYVAQSPPMTWPYHPCFHVASPPLHCFVPRTVFPPCKQRICCCQNESVQLGCRSFTHSPLRGDRWPQPLSCC